MAYWPPCDMKRFYRFVNCYVVYTRKPVDGAFVCRDLERRKFKNSNSCDAKSIALRFGCLFNDLVAYHKYIRKNDWGPLPDFPNKNATD